MTSTSLAALIAPVLDLRVRDLLDLGGAAAISLGMFGAPVALGLANLLLPFDLQGNALVTIVEIDDTDRPVQFSYTLPEPAASAPSVELAPEPRRGDEAVADAEPVETAGPPAAVEPAVAEPPAEEVATSETLPEAPAEAFEHAAEADTSNGTPRHKRELALGRRIDPRVLRQAVANSNPANAVKTSSTATSGTRVSEARKQRRRSRRCEDATGDIREVGPDTYEIERSLVDMYVKDLELAQSLASVAWHRDERGKIDGFRIRRIRCGTVLHQAGFRNGDVVHTVNGKRIRTVFGAISAYRKLKRKEHLKVDATDRDGLGKKLKFHIS